MFLEWILLPSLSALLFVAMLALEEMNRRMGLASPRDGASSPGTGGVEASVFALLGLLLAFQFSGGAGRLDSRRGLTVEEANAIGTAYLRLDLLPSEDQGRLRELFRKYVDTRIAVFASLPDTSGFLAAEKEAQVIQQEIWAKGVQASTKLSTPGVNVLLIPALNEMIDVASTRDMAVLTHGSVALSLFLGVVCLLAAAVAGRAMAKAEKRPLFYMLTFAGLTSLTVYVILDLEFPGVGLIREGVTHQAMYDLKNMINGTR